MFTLQIAEQIFTPISALIFDKDGTLENSRYYLEQLSAVRLANLEKICPGIAKPLAQAYGFELEQQTLDARGLMAVGSRHDNMVAAAAYLAERGQSWHDAWQLALDCFHQADQQVVANPETCLMFPGTKALLQQWQQAGIKIAILSAARQQSVERFIQDHQLASLVNGAAGSDQGLSKPDPALYHQVCDALHVASNETVMIGDAQGDINMAKNAGAKAAINIQWPGSGNHYLKGADAMITTLQDLHIQAN